MQKNLFMAIFPGHFVGDKEEIRLHSASDADEVANSLDLENQDWIHRNSSSAASILQALLPHLETDVRREFDQLLTQAFNLGRDYERAKSRK